MTQVASKPRVATVWLDGCSGCHMSLLDLDERLLILADKVDIVCSPVVDPKGFPENVDLCLVEGAVSSHHDLEKALLIRKNSRIVAALGDCGITGNVPAMRNPYEVEELFRRAYIENAQWPETPEQRKAKLPVINVPPHERIARPIHEVIKVDLHIPGCPPPADAIWFVLTEILEGRIPDVSALTRFGK
ncbi:MAG TPA: NADP oxidoreductase [Phycisphaerae bacterium]|jgi:NAD-reducing hydrogenase small subunit|nr:NADP oxidoreductase [Phycisphaerae bacterium]